MIQLIIEVVVGLVVIATLVGVALAIALVRKAMVYYCG